LIAPADWPVLPSEADQAPAARVSLALSCIGCQYLHISSIFFDEFKTNDEAL